MVPTNRNSRAIGGLPSELTEVSIIQIDMTALSGVIGGISCQCWGAATSLQRHIYVGLPHLLCKSGWNGRGNSRGFLTLLPTWQVSDHVNLVPTDHLKGQRGSQPPSEWVTLWSLPSAALGHITRLGWCPVPSRKQTLHIYWRHTRLPAPLCSTNTPPDGS